MDSARIQRIERKLIQQISLYLPFGRRFPDFFVLGIQKGGSTTLCHMLNQHESVTYSSQKLQKTPFSSGKETHFFDSFREKGLGWYQSLYPNMLFHLYYSFIKRKKLLAFDGTPEYFFRESIIQEIHGLMPDRKFVLLLREPVTRLLSAYFYQLERGRLKPLSFQETLFAEDPDGLRRIPVGLRDNPNIPYKFCQVYNGIYVEYLKIWFKYFSPSQFLILKSEDFFANPVREYQKVLTFLELPLDTPKDLKKLNEGIYPPAYDEIPKTLISELKAFYRPYNEKLYELLDVDFGWNESAVV